MRNEDRSAKRIAKVILLIRRRFPIAAMRCHIVVVQCVEVVIADKLIGIAVEGLGAALGLDLNRAGSVAAILSAIV